MDNTQAKKFYNKGIQYNDQGIYKLAINNFLKSLELDPNFKEARFDLGVAYINNKQYDLAIDTFNLVLKNDKNELCAYSNIALAYFKKGDFDKSIEYHKKILEIKPEDPDTFMDLAYAYVRNQQYDEAIELYNKAMNYGSHRFRAQEGLNTALNLKNGNAKPEEKKKEEVKQVVEEEKKQKLDIEKFENSINEYFHLNKTPESYFNAAVENVREQNFDKAIENLRNALKIEPDFPKAKVFLSKLFDIKAHLASNSHKEEQPEQKELTVDDIMKSIFIDHKALNDSYTLGVSLFNVKNYDLAKEKFEECLKIDPGHFESKEYLKKIDDAQKPCVRPVFIDYKSLNDSYTLGISLFNIKNYDMAKEKFEECLKIDPSHFDSKEYLKKINEIRG